MKLRLSSEINWSSKMLATCFQVVLKPEREGKLVRNLGLLNGGEDLGIGITIEYFHELGKTSVFIEREQLPFIQWR